jgi:hypothetical protein
MDNYFLEKIFPDPKPLFEFEFKDLYKIKDDCLFVFDTNVLFVPFLVSNKSFKDYKNICEKLRDANRLYIPARVAREFAKNRGDNIKTLFRKLHEARERIGRVGFDLTTLPVLEENSDYKRIKAIEKKVEVFKIEYREKIDSLISEIKRWNWNDPVSVFYKTLWTSDSIVEMQLDNDKLRDTLRFKHEHKIAPGYKDKTKVDAGIGDLIVWQTIMELSKEKNKDIAFVTNEEKNDWFYNEKNTALYPKFELFDEFRRFTEGRSIAIINFKDFLEVQEAKSETIDEINELRAPSGFLNIDKDVVLDELKKALSFASKMENGFVGSKFFVESLLARKLYDIASSWEAVNELISEGLIEIYKHHDPNGIYPPISALRLKTK